MEKFKAGDVIVFSRSRPWHKIWAYKVLSVEPLNVVCIKSGDLFNEVANRNYWLATQEEIAKAIAERITS